MNKVRRKYNLTLWIILFSLPLLQFLALVCLAGAGAFAMPQGHGIPAHLLAKRLQGQDTTADEQLLIAEGTPIVVPVGFAAVAEVANCQTGEIIPVDAGNLDINVRSKLKIGKFLSFTKTFFSRDASSELAAKESAPSVLSACPTKA